MTTKNPNTVKLAADMVAQQVAAYDQEIERLRENIAGLEARREAVQMMRNALLTIIGGSKLPPVEKTETHGNSSIAGSNAAVSAPVPISGDITKTIHHPTSTGFADAVRSVLRDAPKGMKPRQVAEEMKTRGTAATYTGKTPFGTRVGNELHRLMRNKEVIRSSGRYHLKTQEEQRS
jgi:hypothetical protein